MRPLAGVKLASLSVIQALDLEDVEMVIFSTDSESYAEAVINDVANSGSSTDRLEIHYRDADSAGSQSKIFDVMRSLANQSFFHTKFVALLLPTAPLRRRSTANKVLRLAKARGQTSFTACPYDFHVSFAFSLRSQDENNQLWKPLLADSPMVTGVTRSQDQSQYLHPHGGLAVAQLDQLASQRTLYDYALPVLTTRTEGLDVDVSEDLDLVRCLEDSLHGTFPFLPEQE